MSEIIYGIHAVKALLDSDPQRFLDVYILKGRDDRRLHALIVELEAAGIVIQIASRQWLDEKVDGAVHQGIVARVQEGRQFQEGDLPGLLQLHAAPFLLVLFVILQQLHLLALHLLQSYSYHLHRRTKKLQVQSQLLQLMLLQWKLPPPRSVTTEASFVWRQTSSCSSACLDLTTSLLWKRIYMNGV